MIFIFKNYSEILLNSLSSVLSYNSFNLVPVLNLRKNSDEDEDEEQVEDEQGEKETEDEQSKSGENLHESTFIKQLIYFLLMTTMNAG